MEIFHLILITVSVAEPVLFGRSRSKDPAPGSTLDKTDKILNDILFLH